MSTSWSCPLWKVTRKLLPIFPKLGHVIWGHEPGLPTLPGKAIKLSFSASPRTLSLRFDSAPVDREAELNTTNQGPDASVVVVQWLSLCLTLCDPMDCSTVAFPVLHYLPEFAQTHGHWVNDAIQPSHPPSSRSPPVLSLSHCEDLVQWVSSLHQVAKLLEFQLQYQPSNEYSLLISFRIHCFDPLAAEGTLKSLLKHHTSKASVFLCSAFSVVQLSHPHMTTGKTIALNRQTFFGFLICCLGWL